MRHVWDGRRLNLDERLWRYCSIARFSWIVGNSKLHFASANQFTDRFEGAVAVVPPDLPVDPRYADMDFGENAFWQLKRLTKINCWHRAEYESDAMWKLYSELGKGIALLSTPRRMRAAFVPFRLRPEFGVEQLYAGRVDYQDLALVRLNIGMLERFFVKHRAFEWEREFRLAISLTMAEENGVAVPELGIEVSANLDVLIEGVVLGPELTDQERGAVLEELEGKTLQGRVQKSTLLGTPRYT